MISFSGWISAVLITFIPMSVFFVGLFIIVRIIKRKHSEHQILPEFKYKHLALILASCLLYSGFNSANRPKLDTTPNQTYEHQVYKQSLERKSQKEIKPVETIQDSYEKRRENILNQFDYKKDQ